MVDDAGSFGGGFGTLVVGLAFSHSGMRLELSYHDFQAPINRVEAGPGHFPGVLGLRRVVIPPSAFSQPDQGIRLRSSIIVASATTPKLIQSFFQVFELTAGMRILTIAMYRIRWFRWHSHV